jgi:hypothetical protein
MSDDSIPLFPITAKSWDVTDPWQFFDPYGAPHTTDLSQRRWLYECDHDGECEIIEGDPTASHACGTPIGYALVLEMSAAL